MGLVPQRMPGWCRSADLRNASASADASKNSSSALALEALRNHLEGRVRALEAHIDASKRLNNLPEDPDHEDPEDTNCGEKNSGENGRIQSCSLTRNIYQQTQRAYTRKLPMHNSYSLSRKGDFGTPPEAGTL